MRSGGSDTGSKLSTCLQSKECKENRDQATSARRIARERLPQPYGDSVNIEITADFGYLCHDR